MSQVLEEYFSTSVLRQLCTESVRSDYVRRFENIKSQEKTYAIREKDYSSSNKLANLDESFAGEAISVTRKIDYNYDDESFNSTNSNEKPRRTLLGLAGPPVNSSPIINLKDSKFSSAAKDSICESNESDWHDDIV